MEPSVGDFPRRFRWCAARRSAPARLRGTPLRPGAISIFRRPTRGFNAKAQSRRVAKRRNNKKLCVFASSRLCVRVFCVFASSRLCVRVFCVFASSRLCVKKRPPDPRRQPHGAASAGGATGVAGERAGRRPCGATASLLPRSRHRADRPCLRRHA